MNYGTARNRNMLLDPEYIRLEAFKNGVECYKILLEEKMLKEVMNVINGI